MERRHLGRPAVADAAADGRLMPHVLHFANALGSGGAEKFVFELALAQAAGGDAVTVVTFEGAERTYDSQSLAAAQSRELAAAGVRVRTVGASGNLPAAAVRFRRVHAEARPDLVHAHLMRAAAVCQLALVPGPVVFTHHSTPLPAPRLLFRLATARVDRFVGISNSSAAALRAAGAVAVETVPNGIDLDRFPAAPERGPPPFMLLTAGNLRREKNHVYLLEIAEELARRRAQADWRIRIAGGGDLRPALDRQIARRGLAGRVEMLGARDDMPALMAAADAYILSSLYEGMPLALIEAMSAALPVLATPVGACPELVAEGGTGFLIPLDDAAAAAGRIERLIEDEPLRRRMAEAARAASRRYTIDAAHAGYRQVYGTTLAQSRSVQTARGRGV